jgi:hypothetical protein
VYHVVTVELENTENIPVEEEMQVVNIIIEFYLINITLTILIKKE